MKKLLVEMICTGDELLCGYVENSNSTFLAQCLQKTGLTLNKISVVGDNFEDITNAFKYHEQANVIIVNGGLGPTSDDITLECFAKYSGVELEKNEEALNDLKKALSQRRRKLDNQNIKQVYLPQKAIVIKNPIGTACGVMCEYNNRIYYFTPGVPKEFKRMITDKIIPSILSKYNNQNNFNIKYFFTFGIGEADINTKLNNYNFPDSIKIGYRVTETYTELKLISDTKILDDVEIASSFIKDAVGDYIISEDSFNRFNQLTELLKLNDNVLIIDNYKSTSIISEFKKFTENFTYTTISNIDSEQKTKHRFIIEIIPQKEKVKNLCISITDNQLKNSFIKEFFIHSNHRNINEIIAFMCIDGLYRLITEPNKEYTYPYFENI